MVKNKQTKQSQKVNPNDTKLQWNVFNIIKKWLKLWRMPLSPKLFVYYLKKTRQLISINHVEKVFFPLIVKYNNCITDLYLERLKTLLLMAKSNKITKHFCFLKEILGVWQVQRTMLPATLTVDRCCPCKADKSNLVLHYWLYQLIILDYWLSVNRLMSNNRTFLW